MKESNNTVAPTWSLDYVNCFLTALHVLVLLAGLVFHPPVGPGADRALPQVTALFAGVIGSASLVFGPRH